MLKVADVNYLREGKLFPYLAASTSNRVILSDIVLIETFKKNPELTASLSLSDMAHYPAQIVVTKQLPLCYHFTIYSAAAARRLFEKKQTAAFSKFMEDARASGTDRFPEWAVRNGHATATMRMAELDRQLDAFKASYEAAFKWFTQDEIDEIRSGQTMNALLQLKMFNITDQMALESLKRVKLLAAQMPKTGRDLRNHLLWRNSLVHTLYFIRWIGRNAPRDVSRKKLINDIHDLHIATLATCFSGVLSGDEELQAIHKEARLILRSAGAYVG